MYIPNSKSNQEVIIHHPQFEYAIEKCHFAYQEAERKKNQRGLLIVGPAGTGKTSVLKYLQKKYPPKRISSGVICPVLLTTVPSKPTVKGLAISLLAAMGEPILKLRTEALITIELKTKIKRMDTRLILLDEFQHFWDQGSRKNQHFVTDWLKTIIEETNIGLVVSGLPYCINIIETNEQLKRRFQAPIKMNRFDWTDVDSRSDFIEILDVIQKNTNLKFPDLTTDSMAYRWYCVSGGLIGRIDNLLSEIHYISQQKKTITISLRILELAAKQSSYNSAESIGSPFSKKFDTSFNSSVIKQAMLLGEYKDYDSNNKIKIKPSDIFGGS